MELDESIQVTRWDEGQCVPRTVQYEALPG
jgi:hypothetical protein